VSSSGEFPVDEVFDEDYLYFYEDLLTGERSDAETELVWRLLELEPGLEVLDLACGHGRIANRLAARGARVTGLDATPRFLELARADAEARSVDVEYVHGDMRELPWTARFDRILCWFTAFGYFDDEQNRQVLREARKALRDGGLLLIEGNNLLELARRWQPTTLVERDGDFVIDRHRFDPVTGRMNTERIVVRGGRVRRFTYAVRMFVASELRDWLVGAGFASVDFYDRDEEPLTAEGRRMIAVARR
jgi:2-polyprenyl-3-methyl-5-hydroxy-6-metoxy-1,4-benzoquinol methylase